MGQMLRWDPEDRISYVTLNEEIQSVRTNSRTVLSIFTSEIDESESKVNEVKIFPFSKEVEGSGSVNQGSGDIDHPQ